MNTFDRIKPRQTGKTEDIIELSTVLSELGREVVIVVATNSEVWNIQSRMKQTEGVRLIPAKMFETATRGTRYNTIIIDDISRLNVEQQRSIEQYSQISNAFIYTTNT